jgi:hypothetical protein
MLRKVCRRRSQGPPNTRRPWSLTCAWPLAPTEAEQARAGGRSMLVADHTGKRRVVCRPFLHSFPSTDKTSTLVLPPASRARCLTQRQRATRVAASLMEVKTPGERDRPAVPLSPPDTSPHVRQRSVSEVLAPLKGLCFYRVEVRGWYLPGRTAMLLLMHMPASFIASPS